MVDSAFFALMLVIPAIFPDICVSECMVIHVLGSLL